ncbi:MAG: hypothetical protein V2I56_21695, partial [Desulfobacteraceae bacterium]|nr:hypothetical protein [Desulfobacteraceae bacterium]
GYLYEIWITCFFLDNRMQYAIWKISDMYRQGGDCVALHLPEADKLRNHSTYYSGQKTEVR